MELKRYDFKKVRETLSKDARRQHDEVVSLNSLEMHDARQPAITFGKNGGPGRKASLSEHALRQLCASISVPYNFLKKMSPELRARTVNEFIEKSAVDAKGDRKVIMVRTRKEDRDHMVTRAILPGDYTPVSHLHLLDIASKIEKCAFQQSIEPLSTGIDDTGIPQYRQQSRRIGYRFICGINGRLQNGNDITNTTGNPFLCSRCRLSDYGKNSPFYRIAQSLIRRFRCMS